MIAAIIISALVIIIAVYFVMILACQIVLKQYTTILTKIIDECEKGGVEKEFISEWRKHSR